MFTNLWEGRPKQTPETEIRPVDSLSGLKELTGLQLEHIMLEQRLANDRTRIAKQLKEVTL
jgi:hypothetical protein